MKINNTLIYDYLFCKYKCLLGLKDIEKKPTEYEYFNRKLKVKFTNNYLKKFNVKIIKESLDLSDIEFLASKKEQKFFIKNLIIGIYELENFLINTTKEGNNIIELILFTSSEKIRKEDRLIAAYIYYILSINSKLQYKIVIIFGKKHQKSQVKANAKTNNIKSIIDDILTFDTNEPDFNLNSNCKICSYKYYCFDKAKKDDHLSLLPTLDKNDIKALYSKGIFTLKQFSYTFKPRKKRKDAKKITQRHFSALKALSLRKNTIYVYNRNYKTEFPYPRIYIDVEGYIK